MKNQSTDNNTTARQSPGDTIMDVVVKKQSKLKLSADDKEERHYLHIPQAANDEIEEYCERNGLANDLIEDIKIYTGIVFHFTEMRKMESSRIYHEFFKAVLGDREHDGQQGYGVIKEHALNSVIECEEYEIGEHSRIYWIQPELIDNINRVSIYTEHPIPRNEAYKKKGHMRRRELAIDRFLDEIYLPRMVKIDFRKTLGELGEQLIISHQADSTLSEKKNYTHGKLDDDINKIKKALAGLNHSTADNDGRVYNIMCYLKREMRLINGMNLTEVDISSSQPFILAVILDNIINNRRNRSIDNFIKRIELLTYTNEKSSAKDVMKVINCLKKINNGEKVMIKQSYYKKNDEIFENMMRFNQIVIERVERNDTQLENKNELKFVKKVRKNIVKHTHDLFCLDKRKSNLLGLNKQCLNEESNRHIPISEFENFWFRNRSLFKKDEKGYTVISRYYLSNKFNNLINKGGEENNEVTELTTQFEIKKDTPKYQYLSLSLCGNQLLKEEVDILLKATSTGRFYDFLIGKLSFEKSLFWQNLGVIKKDLSETEYERLKANPHLIDEDRKKHIVKMMVMRWLNDDYAYYSGDDTIENSVFTAMMTVFPYITSIIFLLRTNFDEPEKNDKKKKSSFHSMLSLVESEFVYSVVERCNNRTNKHAPFLVGTVHDSFVVEPKKVKYLREHIKIESEKMFGTACYVKEKEY